MSVDLGDFQVVRQAQRFGNARGTGATDVLCGDDLDGSGGLQQLLRFLGDRGHLDVHQIIETQLLQVPRARVCGWRGMHGSGLRQQDAGQHRREPAPAACRRYGFNTAAEARSPLNASGHGLASSKGPRPSACRLASACVPPRLAGSWKVTYLFAETYVRK